MKTCIAYYSQSGNTKMAAEYLAEKINADLITLRDETKYKGILGFVKGGMNASLAKKAKLSRAFFDEIAKFDRIILATPVWAGKTTPAINAILSAVDFEGKEVYVLTTQADPNCKGADNRKAFYKNAVGAKHGTFLALFSLHGSSPGATASREDMIQRVDSAVDIALFTKP